MSDFLFSGVLVDFPDLKLAYSEGQMGWVPYILERADDVWEEHRAWGGVRDRIPEPPSTYYYDHIYTCFFRDRHRLKSLDEVGVDNVTFETDYPHTDSTWPDTKAVATKLMEGDAPAAVQATLSFGNAMSSMSDFLFSGVLVDFPDLKLAYSEGQIGWIPYLLERADDVWSEHRAWGGVADLVPEPPSTYYYRQIYGCFFCPRRGGGAPLLSAIRPSRAGRAPRRARRAG